MDRFRIAAIVALVLASACAHSQAADKAPAKERVFVTGSHIPVPVDPETGLPRATISPVRIYSRDRLMDTGRGGDVNAALHQLDTSL